MVKYFCDRCKQECTCDVDHNRTLQINDVMMIYNRVAFNGDATMMLCEKCAHKYYDFLRGCR